MSYVVIPQFVQDALAVPKWREVVMKEMSALQISGTCNLVTSKKKKKKKGDLSKRKDTCRVKMGFFSQV